MLRFSTADAEQSVQQWTGLVFFTPNFEIYKKIFWEKIGVKKSKKTGVKKNKTKNGVKKAKKIV